MGEASAEKLSFRTITKEQWQGLIALCFSFLTMLCCGVLVEPFFPPEARKHGVSTSLNGMILSTNSAVSLLTSVVIGMVVAAVGPKIMMLAGIGVYSISFILFGLLEFVEPLEYFAAGAFIFLTINALCLCCVCTSVLAYAAKLFPSNTSLIIGVMETLVALSEGISLLSSSFLHDIGGYYFPFFIFSMVNALSLPLCYVFLPKVKGTKTRGETSGKDSQGDESMTESQTPLRPWDLLKIPKTMLIACIIPLTGVYWSFLGPNLQQHLSPLKLNKFQTNLMFLITSFWYGIFCPFAGWIAGKFPQKWPLIAGGLIGSGIGCAFLGPLPFLGLENTVTQNAITLSVITVMVAICSVPAFESVITYTVEAGYPNDVATYAIASSLLGTTVPIGGLIGSFGGGFMIEWFGFPVAAAIVGAALVVAGLIVAFYFICIDKTLPSATSLSNNDGEAFQEKLDSSTLQRRSVNTAAVETTHL